MMSPIFIGGTMRTGTTLLRALLGQHPHLFGGLETHWFGPELAREYRQLESPIADRLRTFFELDRPTYAEIAACARDPEGFLDGLMETAARSRGKPRWIEKSPDNVLHLERIAARWPSAFFLHCVRDPRDVYASWKRDQKRSLDAYIENALAALRATERRQANLPIMPVRYDRLVTQPRTVMAEVCAFIGETFVPGIEENTSGREDFEKVRAATGKESTVLVSLARPVFTDSIGQYRRMLDEAELRRIETELAPYLDRHFPGWEPAAPQRSSAAS